MSPQQQPQDDDQKIIKARPTKDLFISMLIRDLTLGDAVGDLVDNAVDGARSFRPNGNYGGLQIDIHVRPDEFIIQDNCGGFSVETAREYAFCFGRKEGYPETPGSIGHVGIGMKRAFFKLGNFFRVESVAENSRFEMEQRVSEWRARKEDDWDFEFKNYEEKPFPPKDRGTRIVVTDLRKEATEQFSDNNFLKKLRSKLELEHLYAMHKGLRISLNGVRLKERTLVIISNEHFRPGYWHEKLSGLTVEAYSGISEDSGDDGGWYIFCNERLIVGPETTYVTGWTGRHGGGVAEYHDQFHRFRGYTFFTADNPGFLPWNTTKTGMDMDSPIYKYVRQQMIEMMRPVMTLMNQLKKEKEGDTAEEERFYNRLVQDSIPVPLADVINERKNLPPKFEFPSPRPKEKKKDKGKRILYYKPKEELDKVKEYFRVNTNGEAGEKTFDYFYKNEIE